MAARERLQANAVRNQASSRALFLARKTRSDTPGRPVLESSKERKLVFCRVQAAGAGAEGHVGLIAAC